MNNLPTTKFTWGQAARPNQTTNTHTLEGCPQSDFTDSCDVYFFHKQTADNKQVQVVILGIKDHCIQDWYHVSKMVIIAMDFEAFITVVPSMLLTNGWEYNLNKGILFSTQGEKLFSK